MNERDNIQRFIFENQAVRGEIVHLTDSYTAILAQHSYPSAIAQLLGETLAAAVLLTATLKLQGTLTIQFHGQGPIKLLVARCDHHLHVRGLAKFDESVSEHAFHTAFHQGQLVITIAVENQPTPYQSIVPINGLSISQCLEAYFTQSEQLSTRIWLSVNANHAAGMLLQNLPAAPTQEREEFWTYATTMGSMLTDEEFHNLTNVDILHRLYHEDDIRLFAHKAVLFKCNCTYEKMRDAVRMLGQQDAEALLSTHKIIEVCCEYCNRKFEFDKADVGMIFQSLLH